MPDDRDRDRRRGGYFQGQPGEGNNPGRIPIDPGAEPVADVPEQGRGADGQPGSEHEANPDTGHDPGRNRDEHLHGNSGRGYGGLSNHGFEDRGPGRVFDRGEDYGRADTDARGRAGHGSGDPGRHVPRKPVRGDR